MEPELDNGSVVELVYLAAHGDEAVAVLNLLDVFFPGRLSGDLTEHRLGGRAVCEPTQEGARSARRTEKKRGIRRREAGNGGKAVRGTREGKKKKRTKREGEFAIRLSGRLSGSVGERGRHRQCHHSNM